MEKTLKIKVYCHDGFRIYTLSSHLFIDYELLKRLDNTDYNWEYIYV